MKIQDTYILTAAQLQLMKPLNVNFNNSFLGLMSFICIFTV